MNNIRISKEPETINQPTKFYFHNLDFLRVIAFGMVFALHTRIGPTLSHLSQNKLYNRFLSIITDGGLGVSLFFVLSGFLITYLLLNEVNRTGTINLRKFYMRRTLRIWPLYFAVVIFGFYIYPALKAPFGYIADFAHRPLYQFLFLSNFDSIYLAHQGLTDKTIAMLGITWSVAIEEQFYLVWPLLFILVSKKHYSYIFPAVILGSMLFRYSYRFDNNTLYYHTLSVASDLAVGGLCAWHCLHSPRLLQALRQTPRWTLGGAYVIGGLALLFGDVWYNPTTYATLGRLINSAFFAFIILEQCFAENSIVKLGQFKLLSRLGKYTYGLYLLHPIADQISDLIFRALHRSTNGLVWGLAYSGLALIIALVMSYVSYHYFEMYFLRLKERFSSH